MFVLTCEAWPTFANGRLLITFISVSLAALGRTDAAVVKKDTIINAKDGADFMCRDIENDLVLS